MKVLVDDLREKVKNISLGGPQKARERHVSKGKLLVRDRINVLLDKNSPFLEFSQLAAHDLYGEDIPAAGIVTGIGNVQG